MDIEALHYFQYVAKYKNITSAAQQLYISQSTLSRHIMALEDELGAKLFERNNKKMQLTEAGQVFYNDSESFAKHMQKVIHNVKTASDGIIGTLRLTMPIVLHDALHGPLSAMRRKYPEVRITLESYNFNEIPNAVRHGMYDAGLTYDFASFRDENGNYEHMGVLPLRTENFCLLVPALYRSLSVPELMQKITGRLPLILPSHIEPPFLKALLSELQSHTQSKIIQRYTVNTTESVLMNASAGLGYSLVPSSWSHYYADHDEVAFLELSNIQQAKCTVVFLYNESALTQAAQNFIGLMKKSKTEPF